MKNWTLLFLILFLASCKEEEETINLNVTNIQLIDVGQITYDFNFDAALKNDSTCECIIRTLSIKKGDTIESLNVSVKGNDLNINIISAPYNFDCTDDSCFTVHDLYFDIPYLEPNNYNVILYINNGCGNNGVSGKFSYQIQ